MMIFQMILGFMIPEVPEVVIHGERDRKQHFETYKNKKKTGADNPFTEVDSDEETKHEGDDLKFKQKMKGIHEKVKEILDARSKQYDDYKVDLAKYMK